MGSQTFADSVGVHGQTNSTITVGYSTLRISGRIQMMFVLTLIDEYMINVDLSVL